MISQELDKVQIAIITIHRELFDESPSPMKLQKLCYYAQGYALAQEKELFPEDFQAWQHGPVICDLYYKYNNYKWHPINEEVSEPEGIDYKYLKDIVSAYGRYDGAALSTMTHRERPWLDARGNLDESEGSNALITKESLRDYFSSKLKAYG
ncbi:type II toxin-antitoxin system antitoxin SocA domain-containing protein [Anabaena cylindrica UHCC 0172]|uniref:Panacea domain-containing protein n=1 Tax=Anabaena cylindrica TaxID=1165 RepID=UPI002B20BE7E|nr:type II toxin-antitoxin system antitoxin SocA domain-containing protein [Anabaena cylindrica]MEA5552495.1 type II toxin-antitoxin system antitoxin SocA domain-containing protein [Anabaena cylindrica UHCC 0172]